MISIIAAVGINNELGYENDLIWKLKDDLKYFKEKTSGKTIIMGYNTFISLPKMLPNRKHIVITTKDIQIDNVEIFHNKEEILNYIKEQNDEVFIIGGASIYKMFIDEADKLYLTEVDDKFEKADVYFPEFDKEKYNMYNNGNMENDGIKFKFLEYRKKN